VPRGITPGSGPPMPWPRYAADIPAERRISRTGAPTGASHWAWSDRRPSARPDRRHCIPI